MFEQLIRWKSPVDPEDELALFIYRVVRNGIYVPPCGGGVIPEPERAIESLGVEYGRKKLGCLCGEVMSRFDGMDDRRLPEGVWNTVAQMAELLPCLEDSWSLGKWIGSICLVILGMPLLPIALVFWLQERRDERRSLPRFRSMLKDD